MEISELVTYKSNTIAQDPDLAAELVRVYGLMGINLCRACPGKLITAHQELKIKFNRKQIMMPTEEKSARKYYIKEKYSSIRAFGGRAFTNETITDGDAQAMIDANPATKKYFVGFEETIVVPPTEQEITEDLGLGGAGQAGLTVDGGVSKGEVIAAFAKLDTEDKTQFTKSGVPTTKALNEILGKDVPAKLRDEAWAEFTT